MNLIRWRIEPDRIPCGGVGQFGPFGSLQHFKKPPIVCPKPTVRVRGWNQARKVGGGDTVGLAGLGFGGPPPKYQVAAEIHQR